MPTVTRTRLIPIEVEPHVAQFWKKRTGPFIKLNARHKLGNIIWPRREKQPKGWRPKRQDPEKCYVTIRISDTSYNRLYLSEESQKWVASLLKQIFYDIFHREIDQHHIDFGLTYSEAVRVLLGLYQISEDQYNFDSAYRQYQRHKKERKLLINNIQ